MFNFFKKQELKLDEEIKLNPLPLLMIELARIDGSIDAKEVDYINEALKKLGYSETDVAFKKYLNHASEETSLYEWVENINNEYSEAGKQKLMESLWRIVIVDSVKEPQEEALFNKIGDLLKIKRSKLQKIKFKVFSNK